MTNTLETNKPRQISYGEPALAIDFCPTYFCCSTPAQSDPRRSDGVGMRDAVKLACRLQRHGGGAVAGDSEAISVTVKTRDCTQRHFVGHLLPAQGLGVPCAAGINDRRVTHKVCWVNVPAASPHANPVSGAASIIRRVTSFPSTVAIARCQFF